MSLNKMICHYGCIYKITNTINNKCYIGQTTRELEKYISVHFSKALHGDSIGKRRFYDAIRKHGKENFKWEILCYCNNAKELNEAEIAFISSYKSTNREYGYNMAKGGLAGFIRENIKITWGDKISKAKKGIKFTEEHKRKLSEARKAKKVDAWNKGLKKETDERVKKYCDSRTGKPAKHRGKRPKNLTELHKKHRTKILDKNIKQVIALYKLGVPCTKIAKKFKTTLTPVYYRINEYKRSKDKNV